jgi:hypothetical protein
MTSLILFSLSIVCYIISQLQQHGKLIWTDEEKPLGFFGEKSHLRKYKNFDESQGPKFFGSTSFAVALTDCYHLAQFFFHLFIIAAIVTFEKFWPLWAHFLLLYAIRHVIWWALYEKLLNNKK